VFDVKGVVEDKGLWQAFKSLSSSSFVFDFRQCAGVQQLPDFVTSISSLLATLPRNSSIVVLAPPSVGGMNGEDSTYLHGALEGFFRSLSKEVGGKGNRVNMVSLKDGRGITEEVETEMISPLLHFLLSPRSAFVTGQHLAADSKMCVDNALPFRSLEGSLDNKNIVITGAARGIGAAVSHRLYKEGAHLVLVDQPNGGLHQRTAELKRGGDMGSISCIEADVRDPALGDLIVQAANGRVDGIVHNAGITRDKKLRRMNTSWFRDTVGINFLAPQNITKTIMNRQGEEYPMSVVTLSSINGIAGSPGQTNYSATKSALMAYVKAMSAAYPSVHATAVAPGFIHSDMTQKIPFVMREFAQRLNSFSQGGIPEDVAEAIAFLLSPASKSLSGTTLRVCGGHLVGR